MFVGKDFRNKIDNSNYSLYLPLATPPIRLCLPDLYLNWANCQISFAAIGTSIALTVLGCFVCFGLLHWSELTCCMCCWSVACRILPLLAAAIATHTHTLIHSQGGQFWAVTMAIISPFSLSYNRWRRSRSQSRSRSRTPRVLETETKPKAATATATVATQLETATADVVRLP